MVTMTATKKQPCRGAAPLSPASSSSASSWPWGSRIAPSRGRAHGRKEKKRGRSGSGSGDAVVVPARRSSVYKGVTRHSISGRYEAHLWDRHCRSTAQGRRGKQVYLGCYKTEEEAARTHDLAALKCWGSDCGLLNFPVDTYRQERERMQRMTREEYLARLRRNSSGFTRGVSKYRGVTRHHANGRWEARIGYAAGTQYSYLGIFELFRTVGSTLCSSFAFTLERRHRVWLSERRRRPGPTTSPRYESADPAPSPTSTPTATWTSRSRSPARRSRTRSRPPLVHARRRHCRRPRSSPRRSPGPTSRSTASRRPPRRSATTPTAWTAPSPRSCRRSAWTAPTSRPGTRPAACASLPPAKDGRCRRTRTTCATCRCRATRASSRTTLRACSSTRPATPKCRAPP